MSSSPAVTASSLCKKYCRTLKRAAMYGAFDLAKGALGLPLLSDRLRKGEFWALDDINFELKPGESLGIVGHNGAGKSTLLKVLSGIIEPDRGRATIRGRVGSLIQLGAGFHPQLTGRENIYVNGQILGMGRREIDRKFDQIVEFAEVSDFLDTPVKFYSSGMFVRLGFAVAAHLEPDVLLVDEVLAVGDMAFQAKCMDFISVLRRRGASVIFISHNEQLVRRACQRGLLLDHGRCRVLGEMDTVYTAYHKSVDWMPAARAGNRTAEIAELRLLNDAGEAMDAYSPCEPLNIHVKIIPHRPLENPEIDVAFNCNRGYVAAAINSRDCGVELGTQSEPFWIQMRIPELRLSPGGYRLSVQLAGADRMEVHDWRRNEWPLLVQFEHYVRGTTYMPVEWTIKTQAPTRSTSESETATHRPRNPAQVSSLADKR